MAMGIKKKWIEKSNKVRSDASAVVRLVSRIGFGRVSRTQENQLFGSGEGGHGRHQNRNWNGEHRGASGGCVDEAKIERDRDGASQTSGGRTETG